MRSEKDDRCIECMVMSAIEDFKEDGIHLTDTETEMLRMCIRMTEEERRKMIEKIIRKDKDDTTSRSHRE